MMKHFIRLLLGLCLLCGVKVHASSHMEQDSSSLSFKVILHIEGHLLKILQDAVRQVQDFERGTPADASAYRRKIALTLKISERRYEHSLLCYLVDAAMNMYAAAPRYLSLAQEVDLLLDKNFCYSDSRRIKSANRKIPAEHFEFQYRFSTRDEFEEGVLGVVSHLSPQVLGSHIPLRTEDGHLADITLFFDRHHKPRYLEATHFYAHYTETAPRYLSDVEDLPRRLRAAVDDGRSDSSGQRIFDMSDLEEDDQIVNISHSY